MRIFLLNDFEIIWYLDVVKYKTILVWLMRLVVVFVFRFNVLIVLLRRGLFCLDLVWVWVKNILFFMIVM